MERFAIKIDKSVKNRLKNLCRLCGIDNPNQIEILNAAEWIDLTIEGDVTLSKKISDCVGIQVMKNDRMPQRICALCVDKINDFYEFREMCEATNVQTRKLLNLPDPAKAKPAKKVSFKTEDVKVESIFGIEDVDIEPKTEPPTKAAGKKPKKAATSTVVAMNEQRARGMTKRGMEMELERTNKEDETYYAQLVDTAATSRVKNYKKKKMPEKQASDTALLAPKEPNQRERKREIEQKRLEKKRKPDMKSKPSVQKKIKKEPGVCCTICEERFDKLATRDVHLATKHRPLTSEHSCTGCLEQFLTNEQTKSHHEWHLMCSIPYKCVFCSMTFEKRITFQRHLSTCSQPLFPPPEPSVNCDLCHLQFETLNLYNWHSCFIRNNAPCPTCQRIFLKKSLLLKHLFKCTGLAKEAPKKVTKAKKKSQLIAPQNSFKFEPETIIDQNVDDVLDYDGMDNGFMDGHFADSDNEYQENDSITEPAAMIGGTSNISNKTISHNQSNTSNRHNLLANLSLLECRVKLEPLDMSQFSLPSTSLNAATVTASQPPATVAPLVISRPTVPPITLRIKKEVVQPGYDDFDPSVACNIKQEKADNLWELASTSKHNDDRNKIKSRDKKKLYKKPALLAIKIKQERIEREEDDEQYSSEYHDYAMPSEDYSGAMPSEQSQFASNPLPIITQIHSVIEPSTMNAIKKERSTDHQKTNDNSVPFVPIRIKREIQEPPSPTPVDESYIPDEVNIGPQFDAELLQIPYSTNAIETASQLDFTSEQVAPIENASLSPSDGTDQINAMSSEMEVPSGSAEHATEITSRTEAIDELSNSVSDKMEPTSEAILLSENSTNPENSSAINVPSTNADAQDVYMLQKHEKTDNCHESQSIVITEAIEAAEMNLIQPVIENQLQNEVNMEEVTATNSDMVLNAAECDESTNIEVKIDHSNEMEVDEPHQNASNPSEKTTEHPEDEDMPLAMGEMSPSLGELPLALDENEIDDDETKNSKCSASDITVPEVIDDNSIISPIDFVEQNANDDSLNFIDQLVHEVADKLVPHLENQSDVALESEDIPKRLADVPFEGTQFDYEVGGSVQCSVTDAFSSSR